MLFQFKSTTFKQVLVSNLSVKGTDKSCKLTTFVDLQNNGPVISRSYNLNRYWLLIGKEICQCQFEILYSKKMPTGKRLELLLTYTCVICSWQSAPSTTCKYERIGRVLD